MYQIGDIVYVFDTENPKPEIIKDICVGSFINMETGDLYYYTTKTKQPAYAVNTDKEALEAIMVKHLDIVSMVRDMQKDIDARRNALGVVNMSKVLEEAKKQMESEGVANE